MTSTSTTTMPGVPGQAEPSDRPLTRRELRERERRRAAGSRPETAVDGEPLPVTVGHDGAAGPGTGDTLPEQRSASSSAEHGTSPEATSTTPPSPEVPPEASSSGDDDLLPHEPHHYTWKHYLALGAVAAIFGFIFWSLTTATNEPGALGAAATDPTTSLPAQPAPLRGDL